MAGCAAEGCAVGVCCVIELRGKLGGACAEPRGVMTESKRKLLLQVGILKVPSLSRCR